MTTTIPDGLVAIPADVMKLAREAIMAEVKPDARWQYADGRCDHFAVLQAVAKAVMAERQRAADALAAAQQRIAELEEENVALQKGIADWQQDAADQSAECTRLTAALHTVQNAAKTIASAHGTELEHLRQNRAFDHKLRAEHESLIDRDALMTDALLKAEARAEAAESALSTALKQGEAKGVRKAADFEEAIRLAEIGEYLYSVCAYSYGDGYTEPREYGIEWQWQQSKPDEYGQGVLLAQATAWHEDQAAEGTLTEATKLRRALLPDEEKPGSGEANDGR